MRDMALSLVYLSYPEAITETLKCVNEISFLFLSPDLQCPYGEGKSVKNEINKVQVG